MEEVLRLFPEQIRNEVSRKVGRRWDELEEIRLRLNKPVELIFHATHKTVYHPIPTKGDFVHMINQLSEFSLYRMEDELREGYMTIEGGHRVGLAGRVNTINGSVKAIQYITFLNIRIAKEKIGAASEVVPYLYQQGYLNTLIVGAPQTGKTTLIRDITRIISSGWTHIPPQKVGVVDERSEIAASIKGVPQHNIGPRTDVMDACPKAEGMMMMIRSMSPQILVVDEIGGKRDVDALLEAINAGVVVICSIHGQTLDELNRRPSIQALLQQEIFQRIILLDRTSSPGSFQHIYDAYGNSILRKKMGG
ncbi:MAG: stage III sporulation protein AA [Bacillota bacterium]|uniref:Stage III sporulation protein AA n=1 Tax=Virgibacillus salarius TaxID=447199 RepID=A0A941DX59_9BACI|nr:MULTISPECIES: stage III sporulation protein AA [Bacillaceae]NAZ09464.1 stage III sporulation protein AA [Agaribacter marinus]MBR7796754.1 stage III sporulation protein AA [Virgibacillus salarius]MCC2249193.1 stage III sporulation protein AA [Virgibacillus sp. AGTR]MDY7043495.1 stage III sporulation protein AA [Virgibacillus sp. M23]QRZ16904.1 stage III sporulation protein AA [Virgibacillus sp. AGTR]